MPSQPFNHRSDTGSELHSSHRDDADEKNHSPQQKPPSNTEDLGAGASNKAISLTLVMGVGLMLLVLMLPYLGGV